MHFKVGDKVRFSPKVFQHKREMALTGGFFFPPTEITEDQIFEVSSACNVETDDDPDYELVLKGFGWMVWGDEVIKVEEPQ